MYLSLRQVGPAASRATAANRVLNFVQTEKYSSRTKLQKIFLSLSQLRWQLPRQMELNKILLIISFYLHLK